MQYRYKIAGISVLCEIPFLLRITQESKEFIELLQKEEPAEDIRIRFVPVDVLPEWDEGGHWEICRYYEYRPAENRVYYCPARNSTPYACVIWSEEAGDGICYYRNNKISCLSSSMNILDILGLETILLRYQGVLLHASHVQWKERGILFSAPPGTGKSTQADLWVKYENAEIINGDRAALRLKGGKWRAYGLPYAGSSKIYRNESTKVSAVIVLQQGNENVVHRMSAREAFSYLFPEITIHRWEKMFIEQVTDLMLDLFSKIPVYYFSCRPDREAVEVMRDRILKDEQERKLIK